MADPIETAALAEPVTKRYDISWRQLGDVLRDGLSFMHAAERRRALVVSAFVTLSEFSQAISILLVVPLITVIVEPGAITKSGLTRAAYQLAGSPPPDILVPLATGSVIVAFIVSQGLIIGAFMVGERFIANVQARFARDVMRDLMDAPYPWFFGQNAATLTRLFQLDLQYWGRDFVGNVLRLLTNAMTVLAGIAVLVAAAPDVRLLLLVGIGVIAYVGLRLIRPHVVGASTRKRAAAETMVLMTSQIMNGIKDVKANLTQKNFLALFSHAYTQMCRNSARSVIYGQLPSQTMNLVGPTSMVAILFVLWLGGVRGGELAALMAVIVIVTSRVLPAVARMQGLVMRLFDAAPWIRGVAALRADLARVADLARPAGTGPVPDWPRLTFDDVSFVYPNANVPAIRHLDVVIERGGAIGLVGPSGAGKSTCVELLLGLLHPTSGAIRVGDADLSDIDPIAWLKSIGYVPQAPYFLDATIRENVVFDFDRADVDEARLHEALRLGGLADFVASLPEGLETPLGDRAMRLSGGQRQRIAVARALYRQPELLVLDEATASLDSENEKIIVDTLRALKGRVTTVVVSHRMTSLAHCDRIYRLDKGHLVAGPATATTGAAS